eukprot:876205_1
MDTRIMVSGLHSSGKTTSFYPLFHREIQTEFITNHTDDSRLQVETIMYKRRYKKIQFVIYDSDDIHSHHHRHNLLKLFKLYRENIKALIYIIDSGDRESLRYSIECLNVMLSRPQFRNIVLLICANKQDLPHAMSIDEIKCALGMYHDTTVSVKYLRQLPCFDNIPDDIISIVSEYTRHRIQLDYLPQYKDLQCHVQPTVAIGGDGQYEGLNWLSKQLSSLETEKTNTSTTCAIVLMFLSIFLLF